MDQKPEIPAAELRKPEPAKRKRTKSKRARKKVDRIRPAPSGGHAKFPRHSVEKALRIPKAIIEQNAGKECTDRESAQYIGVGFNGPYRVEISSSLKYGLLERPKAGFIAPTDRARLAIRPQKPGDEIEALRQAVLDAPEISEVYKHYRGEYLPDGTFFEHALVDKFSIPAITVGEFTEIFLASLQSSQLVERKEDKYRILDVSSLPDLDVTQNF